jgi:hypothetical protein
MMKMYRAPSSISANSRSGKRMYNNDQTEQIQKNFRRIYVYRPCYNSLHGPIIFDSIFFTML